MYWFLPLTYTLRKAIRLSSGKTKKENAWDETEKRKLIMILLKNKNISMARI
jgi:hypothetical protein